MEKILILDSNSLLNRAFYALPLLSSSRGVHTNAILGYLTMFFKIREEFPSNYVIATFDRKVKTFRHLAYEDYKAGRKSMPRELSEQIEPLKEILRSMNINIFELDGFEADDIIGTISRIYEENGFEPIIVTGDKDALQLCSDITKVIITKKGITDKDVYDNNKMLSTYGVTASEFIDVKAIMGDKSDNIPGVPGIGEKGALKLIREYKSVENIYCNIDSLKEGKLKRSLIEHMDKAILSKKLCKINRNVPIDFNIDGIKNYRDLDSSKVISLYSKYELRSIMDKIDSNVSDTKDKHKNIFIEDIECSSTLKGIIQDMRDSSEKIYIYCDFSGDKVSELRFKNIYINLKGKCFKISYDLINVEFDLVSEIFCLENEKVCFDSKNIYKVLFKHNKDVLNITFDILIGAYLLNSGKDISVINLCNQYANVYFEDHDYYLSIALFPLIYQNILEYIKRENMEDLYFGIEHPLSLVLAEVELEGIRVSRDVLEELRDKFNSSIEEYSEKIYDLAGEEFNINSTKQLGKVLFEKLDLPVVKKTKTGYSTNSDVLESLVDKHDIIQEIINYRQITKLQSTYVIGLMDFIDVDNKIHTSFNQTITTTGRLSSTDPNLQNIPIKYPLGREIRKVFIPEEDSLILSADYSQIELRMLAHISGDENMISAFKEGQDIHRITASEIFSVPENEVTQEMRSKCKAVNFGIVYGISDFALSVDLKVSRKEAREYMDKYFGRYKGVKNYLDNIVSKAKDLGYVSTIFNRKREVLEIKSQNKIIRSMGERLAMNTPIQGSAADIIKLAMIRIYSRLNKEGLKSRIILQIHDELLLNVKKDELERVTLIVKEEMENCYEDMLVPLIVNVSCGRNWFEVK